MPKFISFDMGLRNYAVGGIIYDPEKDDWEIDFWILADLYTGRTFDDSRKQCVAMCKNKKQCSKETNCIPLTQELMSYSHSALMRKKKPELMSMISVSLEDIDKLKNKTKDELANMIIEQEGDKWQDWVSSSTMPPAAARASASSSNSTGNHSNVSCSEGDASQLFICSRHFPKSFGCTWDEASASYLPPNKKPDDSVIVTNLCRLLDKHAHHFLDCRHFRIELQTHQKFVAIAAATNAWIQMRLVIDRGLAINCRNMHAFKKMCVYNGPPVDPSLCNQKDAHDRNKWFAIKHVEWILEHHPKAEEYLPMFLKHPKKDDLADVLLMCLYTAKIEVHKTMPETLFHDVREKKNGDTKNVVMQSRRRGRGRK